MDIRTTRHLAAAAMGAAAGLAIAGFTALGSIFDYPDILQEPTDDILAAYREHAGAISGWFLVLVISAAMLAPVGILLGRLAEGRPRAWITGLGIAAASVQVIGLSRWVLFVPRISDDAMVPGHAADAHHTFEQLHTWLGTIIGETIGYALTATFTIVLIHEVTRKIGPRWLAYVGYAAAILIATGVLIPLDVPGADLANFAGYVLWCLWLLAMAVVLWRVPATISKGVPATDPTIASSTRTSSPRA